MMRRQFSRLRVRRPLVADRKNMPRPAFSGAAYWSNMPVCVTFELAMRSVAAKVVPTKTVPYCLLRRNQTELRRSNPVERRRVNSAVGDLIDQLGVGGPDTDIDGIAGFPHGVDRRLADEAEARALVVVGDDVDVVFDPVVPGHDALVDEAGDLEGDLAIAFAGDHRLELGNATIEVGTTRRSDRVRPSVGSAGRM